MIKKFTRSFLCFILFCLIYNTLQAQSIHYTDEIQFGDDISENAHAFESVESQKTTAALSQQARILLPLSNKGWKGGRMSFIVQVNDVLQNYVTVKFWGSEINHNRLYLVCGNQQIGARHLGEIDMLDIGNDVPICNNRFYYNTFPIPLSLTKGKKSIRLEIRSQGPIWGYGQTWDKYQKNMTSPSKAIYKLYSHVANAFVPPISEQQGEAPKQSVRQTPTVDILESAKNRVNNEITKLKNSTKPLTQMQMLFLAKAYHVKWTYAYESKDILDVILFSLDEQYRAFKANPNFATNDPQTPNADWFGFGPSAHGFSLLFPYLKTKLDVKQDLDPTKPITRREAYTQMFLYARNAHRVTRRMYTNQSMIKDLNGIYLSNKALLLLCPDSAFTEQRAKRYLYESLSLQPWSGNDINDTLSEWPLGKNYWQVTAQGLTKELGYVGGYGEVLDLIEEIYDATRPAPNQLGDKRIQAQIEKMALNRAYFRYPTFDAENFRAMRLEAFVGWRDDHHPGVIDYVQRHNLASTPFQIAVATQHPKLIAYAQQMLDDNQYFAAIEEKIKDRRFNCVFGLLRCVDEYEFVKSQKKSAVKLPMSWDQPNSVFTDEENGVVAIKNDKEIVYASLYWRARHAINNLAKVHLLKPNYDCIATSYVYEEFDSSGHFFKVPNYTNFGFGRGGLKYNDSLQLAHAGSLYPIAKIPAGIPYKVGDEHPLAGRAQLYVLEYGNYYIAMNASDKEKTIKIPSSFENAVQLPNTTKYSGGSTFKLKPMTSLVLYKK